MNKKKSYFILSVVGGLLIFAFNNCTQFSADNELSLGSSLAVCDGQLKAAFQRTYHPFLKNNCTMCHSQAHGSVDLNTSYEAFMDKGENLIDYQSSNAHGGNNFDASVGAKIGTFKSSWTRAKDNYLNCLEESADSGDTLSLRTNSKVITNIARTAQDNSWVPIEWDLETEVEGMSNGKFNAILRAEARLNKINNEIAGLFIRNPSLRLKSAGKNISVSGLMLYVDNVKQTAVTTYSGVSKIVDMTANINLANSSGAAYVSYSDFNAQTTVAVEFNEILFTNATPDDPEPPVVLDPVPVDIPLVPVPDGGVTYDQLTSRSSPYRVFNRTCVGCHNNNSGRLNLTNYETARDNSSLIIQRMNSAQSPMPPTGRLRQNDRDLVQSWVNAGSPKR